MAVKQNIVFKENNIHNSCNVQFEGEKEKIIQYAESQVHDLQWLKIGPMFARYGETHALLNDDKS